MGNRTIELDENDVALIIRKDNSVEMSIHPSDSENPTPRIMYIAMCTYSWLKEPQFVKDVISKFAKSIRENKKILMS